MQGNCYRFLLTICNGRRLRGEYEHGQETRDELKPDRHLAAWDEPAVKTSVQFACLEATEEFHFSYENKD